MTERYAWHAELFLNGGPCPHYVVWPRPRATDSIDAMTSRISLIAALASGFFAWSAAASADSYVLPPPDVDLIGSVQSVRTRHEDTLLDIGRRHGVGYEEMVRANPGVDPWLPGDGTQVTLPTRFILPDAPREGVVLNVAEMRLYYFPKPKAGEEAVVITHPISIGRQDWSTPLGLTRVVAKSVNPVWYPPASVRAEAIEDGRELPAAVPPGPDNPLGSHALRLGIPGYLIHGTNKPAGVGMRVTHGCVRMFPEDIAQLFDDIPVGTPVRIVNQPYKMGWLADTLFLEAHPPLPEDKTYLERGFTPVMQLYVARTKQRETQVDWELMETVYRDALGYPSPLSVDSGVKVAEASRMSLVSWCSSGSTSTTCGEGIVQP